MKMRLEGKPLAIMLARMALLFVAVLCLSSCARNGFDPEASRKPRPETTAAKATATPKQEDTMTGNLMAWAESREEAEKIAVQYGITLLLYSDNIAVFYTDQDPDGIIKLGKAKGWPELSKNNIVTINDP